MSCFAGSEIQAWDISDPEHIKLHDTIQGVVQPNMMHVTFDGRRLYFTNSAISTHRLLAALLACSWCRSVPTGA